MEDGGDSIWLQTNGRVRTGGLLMNRWTAGSVTAALFFTLSTVGGHSAAAAAQRAPTDQHASQFVEKIVAYERRGGRNDDRMFLSFFTPELAALIRADRKAAGDQDVPYLDGDPFCDCQDSEGLAMRVQSIAPHGNRIDAVIRNHFTGSSDPDRLVTLRLRLTASGWRVDDVLSQDQPSLRAGLARALRRH